MDYDEHMQSANALMHFYHPHPKQDDREKYEANPAFRRGIEWGFKQTMCRDTLKEKGGPRTLQKPFQFALSISQLYTQSH